MSRTRNSPGAPDYAAAWLTNSERSALLRGFGHLGAAHAGLGRIDEQHAPDRAQRDLLRLLHLDVAAALEGPAPGAARLVSQGGGLETYRAVDRDRRQEADPLEAEIDAVVHAVRHHLGALRKVRQKRERQEAVRDDA